MEGAFDHTAAFRTQYPSLGAPLSERKPFNHGEFTHYSQISFGGENHEIEKYFHNYDVPFHNEIWASAFSGKFAAGTTWHWERVFWWEDALKPPPPDGGNDFQTSFSNVLNTDNLIDVGLLFGIPIKNKPVNHHFQPLSDLLSHPSWTAYDFFNLNYMANKAISAGGEVESYFLKNDDNTVAIGWVHNRWAWEMNEFYLANSVQNFLGCTAPSDQSIMLSGFEPNTEYNVTWFPTHTNTTVCPDDAVATTSGSGGLILDMTSEPFSSTIPYYLDTLHSDYAFIITTAPFVKSLMLVWDSTQAVADWDFTLYPNPAHESVLLRFAKNSPKQVSIVDAYGRILIQQTTVNSLIAHFSIDHLAKGAYWIRVSDGTNSKVKKLIVH
jgi:hypothetical protein